MQNKSDEKSNAGERGPYKLTAILTEPIAPAIFKVVAATVLGAALTIFYSQYMKNRDAINQKSRTRMETSRLLAEIVFERQERSVLLYSGIKNLAFPADEITYRKRRYDESYIEWNRVFELNKLRIKNSVAKRDAQIIEQSYSRSINPAFAVLDDCLTSAYLARVSGDTANSSLTLQNCKAGDHLRQIETCAIGLINFLDHRSRQIFTAQRKARLNPLNWDFWKDPVINDGQAFVRKAGSSWNKLAKALLRACP